MHYYQFNIGNYRRDTSHLTKIEHYIYRTLIDWYYLDEGPIKISEVKRKLQLTDEEVGLFENLANEFFKKRNGKLYHKKIDEALAKYGEKSNKAKASANARWSKKPQCERNANASKAHSEGNANNKPKNHKPSTNKDTALPGFVDSTIWDNFLKHRIAIKARMTDQAKTLLINKLIAFEKDGEDVNELLNTSIMNGWKSVFAAKGKSATASAPWQKVLDKIGSVPATEFPEFEDPLISKAIFKAGSWMEICRLTSKQLDFEFKPKFLEAYKSLGGE